MKSPKITSRNARESRPPVHDLSAIAAAVLLTADCMGTGILALPADVHTLGMAGGLVFLIANLPINLYAGTILSKCAAFVEERILNVSSGNAGDGADRAEETETGDSDGDVVVSSERHGPADAATKDFVGLTSLLFDEPLLPTDETRDASPHQHQRTITYAHPFTKAVLVIYYINIFLVLGNYILVMSHAVDAMVGEDYLCIPAAGAIASILMFALSQLRTMANLGRSVSAVSLLALLIVVVQCLVALHRSGDGDAGGTTQEEEVPDTTKTETALADRKSVV